MIHPSQIAAVPPAAAGVTTVSIEESSSDDEIPPGSLFHEDSRGSWVLRGSETLTVANNVFAETLTGRSWEVYFYEVQTAILRIINPAAMQTLGTISTGGGGAYCRLLAQLETSPFQSSTFWNGELAKVLPDFRCCAPDPNAPIAFKPEHHGDNLRRH